MKITFPPPTDDKTHRYCLSCGADGIELVKRDGLVKWQCGSCGEVNDRYLHIGNTDHDGKWWLDDTGELWHESAGVFVRNPEGKYLFFERIAWPLGYTIPAGHVDNGEDPQTAAVRELYEEVGITSKHLIHVIDDDIVGDSCVGGADVHRWHGYREDVASGLEITVTEEDEGRRPIWMTLEEAKTKELPFAIRYIIEKHGERLEQGTDIA